MNRINPLRAVPTTAAVPSSGLLSRPLNIVLAATVVLAAVLLTVAVLRAGPAQHQPLPPPPTAAVLVPTLAPSPSPSPSPTPTATPVATATPASLGPTTQTCVWGPEPVTGLTKMTCVTN